MAERILYPEWPVQNRTTRYPFSAVANLTTTDGHVIPDGAILDASLYPVGGQSGLYLSSVVIAYEMATLYIGNVGNSQLCSAQFGLTPPTTLAFADSNKIPSGIMVAGPVGLDVFQSWGVGTHTFNQPNAEFAATVCVPTPEYGIRGILLADGTLMTGDVWLVGGDGVVLSGTDNSEIRVDVVGDPLFRRQLCSGSSLFSTPNFLKKIRFLGPNGEDFTCTPDANGNIMIVANNTASSDTVLRVTNTPDGVTIGAVGSPLGS